MTRRRTGFPRPSLEVLIVTSPLLTGLLIGLILTACTGGSR